MTPQNYISFSSSLINTSTLEETIRHMTSEFPYMADLCLLHTCPGGTFPWHWHNEVEFFYMRSGSLEYVLPHGTYTFHEGEGGFVNSGVLHMTSCIQGKPCVQEEHIFHPSFLGGTETSILMNRYINPVIQNTGIDILSFDASCPRNREILSLMRESYDYYTKRPPGYEFDVRETMTRLWRILFSMTKDLHVDQKKGPHRDRIKTMMAFIASHYQEKLTLKKIADSAFISPRECSRCFQENLGQSPFSYVLEYRLHKACSILTHTSLSVTEVSSACGFGSISYFGQAFRDAFGCTPREYRRRHMKSAPKE